MAMRPGNRGTEMDLAALTPRVRILVVCDDVLTSETEAGVFNLEGVRQHLTVRSVPIAAPLNLFLLLSNPRHGTYEGKVLVVHDGTDRTVRYVRFAVAFQEDNEVLPLWLDLGVCEFPEPGSYTFQVWFSSPQGGDALKGELPFHIVQDEE